MRNSKGFTLIELLVVMTIITILATISIPQFAKYRVTAFNTAAISDLRNAKVELEGYYLEPTRYNYPIMAEVCYSSKGGDGSCLESAKGDLAAPGFDFIFSNKVQHAYQSDEKGMYYVLATKHINGNTVYASGSNTSRIYMSRNSGGGSDWRGVDLESCLGGDVTLPAPDNASDAAFVAGSWGEI